VVRVALRAVDGTEIVAHVGPEQSLPALRPGLALWVSWEHGAARLLPPAAGTAEAEMELRHTYERAGMSRP
jgi:spermidine/putrescine transport system ATP-binding protein